MGNLQNEEKEAYWLQKEKERTDSGLSRNQFCKRNSLNYHQFSYWMRKSKNNTKKPFIQLSPDKSNRNFDDISNKKQPDHIEVILGDKIRLNVPVSIFDDVLQSLMELI